MPDTDRAVVGASNEIPRRAGCAGPSDADMYVRLYAIPTSFANDCASTHRGRRGERCAIRNPFPGIWYVAVDGFTDYTGLVITATY